MRGYISNWYEDLEDFLSPLFKYWKRGVVWQNQLLLEDISDQEAKKNTYIHMFTGMGYDRFKVEKTWNCLDKLMKQFDIPFEKAMGCMIYALKYDCGIEIPLKNICGIDVGLIEKSIPVYQKEMVKCFGMALAGGLVYLLAESLSKE